MHCSCSSRVTIIITHVFSVQCSVEAFWYSTFACQTDVMLWCNGCFISLWILWPMSGVVDIYFLRKKARNFFKLIMLLFISLVIYKYIDISWSLLLFISLVIYKYIDMNWSLLLFISLVIYKYIDISWSLFIFSPVKTRDSWKWQLLFICLQILLHQGKSYKCCSLKFCYLLVKFSVACGVYIASHLYEISNLSH